ncbi:MAG TPA: hypothetical protein VGL09_12655 [Methylomirabilota bacterium]
MTDRDDVAHPQWTEAPHADAEVESFAGGEIQSFHGRVNAWLLAVYGVLAVWGVYYVIKFWGGLGPGQGR